QRAGSPLIHVHNKVLIQDDTFGLVGSANCNGRSMRWDTEAALRLDAPSEVAALRAACARHWWFDDPPEAHGPPDGVFDWWCDAVAANGAARPEDRTGFLVPYNGDKARRYRQELPGVTQDIV
ncbi:MAG: phospholipase D-like domain-containing protein, partial [Shimia sp.]